MQGLALDALTSTELRDLIAGARRELQQRRPTDKKCVRCSAPFAGRSGARYCSVRCRVASHRTQHGETKNLSIIGIGYQGLTLEQLIERLQRRSVQVLIDVRLNAISRKRGFSKRALAAALEAGGIRYVHLPALGNARENREGYGEVDTTAARRARSIFQTSLDGDDAQAAMDELVSIARAEKVAVFCFEENEHHCHRQQVIERASRRFRPALVA